MMPFNLDHFIPQTHPANSYQLRNNNPLLILHNHHRFSVIDDIEKALNFLFEHLVQMILLLKQPKGLVTGENVVIVFGWQMVPCYDGVTNVLIVPLLRQGLKESYFRYIPEIGGDIR